ncbi:MAG: hypothetical protein ACEQSK_11885, partial [Sphingomonadaceae bacterium]
QASSQWLFSFNGLYAHASANPADKGLTVLEISDNAGNRYNIKLVGTFVTSDFEVHGSDITLH